MPKASLPHANNPVLMGREETHTKPWSRFFEELRVRIGADKDYSLGGILSVDTASVGNVGTGEDDLISYSLQKNVVSNLQDKIEIEAFGTFANNSNNKTVKLIFGSTTLFSTGAVAFQNQDWCLRSSIIRTGSSTQKCITTFYTDYADITNIIDYVSGTEDFTTALTIKCTGQATSDNDIVQEGLSVKLFPR